VAIDNPTRLAPLKPQIPYKHTQKFIKSRESNTNSWEVVLYPRQQKKKTRRT